MISDRPSSIFPFLRSFYWPNGTPKDNTVNIPPESSFFTLPREIIVLISSSCSFLTVCALDRTCKRPHNYRLPHELTLVRRIAHTVHHNSQFNITTTWSAHDLKLEQAKAVCIAGEMIIKSIEEPEVSLTSLLKWWVTLAIHSHPLISV
jgi:hypothetical protein